MDLNELREKIDRIDDELVRLFCERMRVCGEVAQFKARGGLAVLDVAREKQKLADVLGKSDEDLRRYVEALYLRVFELSREFQAGSSLEFGIRNSEFGIKQREAARNSQFTIHNSQLGVAPLEAGGNSLDESVSAGNVSLRRFGVLGERLGHSFSPRIHALLADYDYRLYEKSPGEVGEFLRCGDFDGLNVTMPYKKTVIPFCAELSEVASRIGSVNTLVRMKDGALFGDNTDYFGFSFLLRKMGVDVSGKKVLVLGDGGAAATVRAVLGDGGAGEVVTVSRRGPDNYENISRHSDAGIIVNTTPVGMYPGNGASPVELGLFSSCEAVFDLINNPLKTELILQAEDRGMVCAGGLYMLVAQAKRASELFLGRSSHSESHYVSAVKIEKVTKEIERNVKNIALVGMPGCGKTTVGRSLASLTGREFFDTDELVVIKAGKSVERIFADDGEEVFRNLEEAVLCEVSKKTGCVIATGGGIVTRKANRRFLRQNSAVVFIERAPEELPDNGRPLSLSAGVDKLFKERLPLYDEWCDHRVAAREGLEETARAVMGKLQMRNDLVNE